jgi:hypothetical protein
MRKELGNFDKGKALKAASGIVLVATLALTAAACSSSPSSTDSVASLPGHNSGSGGTTSGTLTQSREDQDEINFAHCLRRHGVNEPDPKQVPGQSGLVVQVPASGPTTSAALAACNHFLPPTSSAKRQQRAADLPGLTHYAQCMRAHDIPLLDPDPNTGSVNLGNVPGITSGFGRYSPEFRSADGACRHLLPSDVHDDGTGP